MRPSIAKCQGSARQGFILWALHWPYVKGAVNKYKSLANAEGQNLLKKGQNRLWARKDGLKQAVRRNIKRFPEDFMFKLSKQEVMNLRSQFVTSRWGGARYCPMAFTEQGVAMLSSVLNSERAVQVNIQIMRAFTRLRRMLADNEDLRRRIEEMEAKYDEQFRLVFEAIKQLLSEEEKPTRKSDI